MNCRWELKIEISCFQCTWCWAGLSQKRRAKMLIITSSNQTDTNKIHWSVRARSPVQPWRSPIRSRIRSDPHSWTSLNLHDKVRSFIQVLGWSKVPSSPKAEVRSPVPCWSEVRTWRQKVQLKNYLYLIIIMLL